MSQQVSRGKLQPGLRWGDSPDRQPHLCHQQLLPSPRSPGDQHLAQHPKLTWVLFSALCCFVHQQVGPLTSWVTGGGGRPCSFDPPLCSVALALGRCQILRCNLHFNKESCISVICIYIRGCFLPPFLLCWWWHLWEKKAPQASGFWHLLPSQLGGVVVMGTAGILPHALTQARSLQRESAYTHVCTYLMPPDACTKHPSLRNDTYVHATCTCRHIRAGPCMKTCMHHTLTVHTHTHTHTCT